MNRKFWFIFINFTFIAILSCTNIDPAKDIKMTAKILLRQVEKTALSDPQTPLKDYIPQLKDIIKYTESIINKETPYDDNILAERIQKLSEIKINYEQMVKEVLENDVSFKSGKWDINNLHIGGKQILNEVVSKISNTILKECKKKYPNEKLAVLVTTIGHADEQRPIGNLARYLDSLPESNYKNSNNSEDIRKERNRVLSLLRARTVMEYIINRLRNKINDDNITIKERKVLGLGEELPPNNQNGDPFKPNDERRRICRIFGNVEIIK